MLPCLSHRRRIPRGRAAARFRGDTAHGDAYYKKFPHVMDADDIARGTIYALDQPRSVTIAQMLILPTRDL